MFIKRKKFYKSGFTLAEVLLTITVIGIVAAMTIPELVNSVQDQQYAVALKKNYSILSEATQNLENNYGTIDTSTADTVKNAYKKVLNYIKSADVGTSDTIYPMFLYYYKSTSFDSSGSDVYSDAVLSDGTVLIFYGLYGLGGSNDSPDCTTSTPFGGSLAGICAAIGVDLNGKKGPNMAGKDYFEFWLIKKNTSYAIIPAGSNNDGASCVPGSTDWKTSQCANYILTGTPFP